MSAPDQPWFPIRTERLLLREFRDSDLDDIHAYAAMRGACRFMAWGPNTAEDSRAFLGPGAGEGQAEWLRPGASAWRSSATAW